MVNKTIRNSLLGRIASPSILECEFVALNYDSLLQLACVRKDAIPKDNLHIFISDSTARGAMQIYTKQWELNLTQQQQKRRNMNKKFEFVRTGKYRVRLKKHQGLGRFFFCGFLASSFTSERRLYDASIVVGQTQKSGQFPFAV